ncbi:uncharacterized protein TrAtP1_012150 [Trichoderma atroviride]|uniref:uncharacterized protein n=1 Tax=Hypocrea atroviridis TaxID=63577 RepID=UPI00332C745B|nr:hypothetical protein TrAtP1_012150 [Trichoderma atroviride]
MRGYKRLRLAATQPSDAASNNPGSCVLSRASRPLLQGPLHAHSRTTRDGGQGGAICEKLVQ